MSSTNGRNPKNEVIIGIDLGTTHSLVARVENGTPKVLELSEGSNLLPSVVVIERDHLRTIGYSAKRNRVIDPSHTLYSVKRLLGRNLSEVSDEVRSSLSYELVDGGSEGVKILVDGEKISPVDVSAMILRTLKEAAQKDLNTEVKKAVITVPAYFNDSQRQATRNAGRIAGLQVVRILNEPTAAALAYGLGTKPFGLIAVYDFGGGTFDFSILKVEHGVFEVLATAGDTCLGGDDCDWAIAQVMAREIEEKFLIDVFSDSKSKAELLAHCERLKIELSANAELSGDAVEAFIDWEISPQVNFFRKVSRKECDEWLKPLIERTLEPCRTALADSGVSKSEITDVVLVGGSTRLPSVRQAVAAFFEKVPKTDVNPDEAVALGAAIQADILAGNNRDFLLLDVVPLSLGIETYGGAMEVVIARNSKVPAIAKQVFTTFVDRQTAVDIHVAQGEREMIADNQSLAKFKLRGLTPMPAGLPRIEVSFVIDADGILQVSAKDQKTGTEQTIEVRPTAGLSEDQIKQAICKAESNAETDRAAKELINARIEAEPVVRATQKHLDIAQKQLSSEEFQQIKSAFEDLQVAIRGQDPSIIRRAAFTLDRVTKGLADLVVSDLIKTKRDKVDAATRNE